MTVERSKIWLEVANVRIETGECKEGKSTKEVTVQLTGDQTDQEPVWWRVEILGENTERNAEEAYRNIADGLDKKRTVLASLQVDVTSPPATSLYVKHIRVQHSDSAAR